ncbi:hypothetical protein ACP4OV_018539 [Aristida adscensionis]
MAALRAILLQILHVCVSRCDHRRRRRRRRRRGPEN